MRRSSFSPEPDCAIAQSLGRDRRRLGAADRSRPRPRAGPVRPAGGVAAHLAQGADRAAERPARSGRRRADGVPGAADALRLRADTARPRAAAGAGRAAGLGRPLAARRRRADRAPDAADQAPAHRVHELVGRRIPSVALPSTARYCGDVVDVDARATVLFGYPATGRPTPAAGRDGPRSPAHRGCTLENKLFAEKVRRVHSRRHRGPWREHAAPG